MAKEALKFGTTLLYRSMNDTKFQDIKLCECGCGQPAPIATRNWHKKGIAKGQPLRFICGHHRRGKQQSKEEKLKRVKSWGVENAEISPFLPDLRIVRYYSKQKRWYCTVNGKNSKKPHARAVYEHYHGEVPAGMVVHHKSGSAENIEDDHPSNLMLLPHKWNWRHLPCLSEGFEVPENLVTQFYCESATEFSGSDLFRSVCKKLIEHKEAQCPAKRDTKTP